MSDISPGGLWTAAIVVSVRSEIAWAAGPMTHDHQLSLESGGHRWPRLKWLCDSLASQRVETVVCYRCIPNMPLVGTGMERALQSLTFLQTLPVWVVLILTTFLHRVPFWSKTTVWALITTCKQHKRTELPRQQRPGNSISAHTFNYACYRHREDKDMQWGHRHRHNSEYVTLKATIKLDTKNTDRLRYKKREAEKSMGEWIEQPWTDRKRSMRTESNRT